MGEAPLMAVPAAIAPRHRNATNYRRGATFERQVAAALEVDGYRVIRAAGSHGKADLVALKPSQVVLVQCKLSGPGGVRPAEWNELFDLATGVNAVPIVAHRPKRGLIEYLRMTGPKDRPGRRAPAVIWTPDEINGGNE